MESDPASIWSQELSQHNFPCICMESDKGLECNEWIKCHDSASKTMSINGNWHDLPGSSRKAQTLALTNGIKPKTSMLAKIISCLCFQYNTFHLPNMSCNKLTEFYLSMEVGQCEEGKKIKVLSSFKSMQHETKIVNIQTRNQMHHT